MGTHSKEELAVCEPRKRSGEIKKLVETLSNYLNDKEFKVRSTSLAQLLDLYSSGYYLDVELYDVCVVASKDDHYQVRLYALEMLSAIASIYPDQNVVVEKNDMVEYIRLLDDAFVKICDMVNDSSVIVRQRACTVLGRFYNVNSKFLFQTLSKQVMSNLKRYVPKGKRESARQQQKAKSKSGKATGDANVESESFRLLDSGAAGAFVHGLEDEYQEVRDAAIESITELSIRSNEFGAKTVDFLVDMFNDSSDNVRLNAVRALNKIGSQSTINLNSEQLSIALSAMEDANSVIREGVHGIFSVSQVDKLDSLTTLVNALHKDVAKYPEDQYSVWKAFKHIGCLHSGMITADFVCALLKLDTKYLAREPNLVDREYTGNFIMIFNTSLKKRRSLQSVLPDFVYMHLPYFRDKLPDCFPADLDESVPPSQEFVLKMLRRPEISTADTAAKTLESTVQGLGAIIDSLPVNFAHDKMPGLAVRARGLAGQLQAVYAGTRHQPPALVALAVDYIELIHRLSRIVSMCDATDRLKYLLDQCAAAVQEAQALEHRYVGLGPSLLTSITHCHLLCNAMWLYLQLRSLVSESSQSGLDLCSILIDHFARRLATFSDLLKYRQQEIGDLPWLADCIGQRMNSEGISREDVEHVLALLLKYIKGSVPTRVDDLLGQACQRTSAELKTSESKYVVEFNHQFPILVGVNGEIRWADKTRTLAIEVRTPGNSVTRHVLARRDLVPSSSYAIGIATNISVSLPLCSGITKAVELDLVVLYSTDQPVIDHLIIAAKLVPADLPKSAFYPSSPLEPFSCKVTESPLKLNLRSTKPRPLPRKTF
ncbi:hypothetical protein EV182_002556 [Spiromyces aspiralis]|uniref:Uncharacterized protein n=1 Tax=Spiromyces aspiralis TaxID=68401 RepID=A0ACC1HFK1_9FUNG|nr:hypothetical protein EV182_002556 [Spiromyces aspiralis]